MEKVKTIFLAIERIIGLFDSLPIVILIIFIFVFFANNKFEFILKTIAKYVKKASKNGFELREPESGLKTVPNSKKLDEIEKSKDPDFWFADIRNHLDEENGMAKKIFSTLWKYQNVHAPKLNKRWMFNIGNEKEEFDLFMFKINQFSGIGLITEFKPGLYGLTDFGIRFCQKYEKELKDPEYIYAKFQ